ncbi:MAG: SH3 domain-containing protein [Lachnospiraceae bacterium]|nr:SH3 domain-containing protein [Lachnospiraceae bacterium]
MRHNRKAVMAERYQLYLKKHIFNGKYFVRNMQIFVCLILMVGTVTCVFALSGHKNDEAASSSTDISIKDALFGTKKEPKNVIESGITDDVDKMVLADSPNSSEEQKTTEQTNSEQIMAKRNDSKQNDSEQVTTEEASAKSEEEAEPPVEEPKSEFDEKCIANVEETLNIRKEASTESDFVGCMNPGAIATVEGSEGDWTKIKSGEVEGYVLTDYILTGKEAEQLAANYVTLRGTVLEDGVNVRTEKSTDADIVAVLDKDATLTVVEENEEKNEKQQETDSDAANEEVVTVKAVTTDEEEITWLSVELDDGQTGYVSASLVDVDELYEIAVSAEELEQQAEEEARKAAEEAAAKQAAEEAAANAASQPSQSNGGGNQPDDDYQGATTTPVTATESGDCLGTFTITAYCGCNKCSGGNNKTATGTTPTEGRTIAADTSILPYGTQVVIGGVVYTVEDCGSGVNGKHIDIFFATHKRAMAFGRKSMKVYKY